MKNKIILFIIIAIIGGILYLFISRISDLFSPYKEEGGNNNMSLPTTYSNEFSIQDFDYKMIQEVNKNYKENYMISPLSIGYALSMLKDGANENTLKEIENVLNDYKLPNIINVENKLSIANIIFIKNTYKDDISQNYIKLLNKNYDAEVMFDKFNNPDKINKWITNKTFNMIKDPIKQISPNFILGLANTIAIDLEWKDNFDKEDTYKDKFTLIDNTTMDVNMMNKSNDVIYIESENAKGIIKDYAIYDKDTGSIVDKESEDTISLEYIALLPNNSIEEYLKVFNNDELNKLYSSKKLHNDSTEIYYKMPRYTYDFDYKTIKDVIYSLGIHDIFSENANFDNMKNKDSKLGIMVNDIIHKTHIEVSEKGTKASAATIIMMRETALADEDPKEYIHINFNKPFIYLIKEKNTNNIWFFGTVYEPLKWEE